MYQPNYGYQYPFYNSQQAMPDNLAQLRMNTNQMQNPSVNQQMPSQPTQPTNSLIWVQGEAGAKSYLVAPNATVMLMDSEGDVFYIKSADASGMPLPLRTFEYREKTNAAKTDQNAPASVFDNPDGKYITREEFERRIADLTAQTASETQSKKRKNNLTEDAENA